MVYIWFDVNVLLGQVLSTYWPLTAPLVLMKTIPSCFPCFLVDSFRRLVALPGFQDVLVGHFLNSVTFGGVMGVVCTLDTLFASLFCFVLISSCSMHMIHLCLPAENVTVDLAIGIGFVFVLLSSACLNTNLFLDLLFKACMLPLCSSCPWARFVLAFMD